MLRRGLVSEREHLRPSFLQSSLIWPGIVTAPWATLDMIKRGRKEGWLKQPVETLPTWAEFNGAKSNGIRIGPMPGLEQRGSTVIATRNLSGGKEDPLIVVPKDLIISKANVELYAKSDQHLKQVLEAAGDFGRVSRSQSHYELCC